YESKTADGAAFVQPLLVRLCDKAVQLIGRLKGPVEKMGEPAAKEDAPGVATLHVEGAGGGADVKLAYQFAQGSIDQPAWLKPGIPTSASAAASASAPK